MDASSTAVQESNHLSTKRKRSLSIDALTQSAPAVKLAKTHSNHLQINYLARQSPEVLPLITTDDALPSLLSLIADYEGVLQRHESMAGNLGARPLGPILIKRFERLFDGPPRVLKSHGKEGTSVGWLDVVEFARNKPEQFNLEKMRDGVRVCQFYTKQSRVEITEEDYVLIASGMPQKLIPPQPIMEDEEKELGTLEILEKNLGHVVQLADQVSARARQLNHRLKNRKNAIISRREAEAPISEDISTRSPRGSGARAADTGQSTLHTNGDRRSSVSPSSRFVAVNSRQTAPSDAAVLHDTYTHDPSRMANVTIVNGTSLHGASAATRAELLSKFFTTSERAASVDYDQSRRGSIPTTRPSTTAKSKATKVTSEPADYVSLLLNSASPVPIPNTPSALLPYVKPSPVDRFDDSGPYKAEMVTRMEQLQRGDRIQPPCDRCRRLHMDCLKNLTACMGCTKKHAKCSWKDVNDEELRENPYVPRDEGATSDHSSDRETYHNPPTLSNEHSRKEYPRDERQGVADEELLGEDASADEEDEDLDPPDDHDHRDHQSKRNHIEVATAGRFAPSPPPNTDFDPDPIPQKDSKADSPSHAASYENTASFHSVNGSSNPDSNVIAGGKTSEAEAEAQFDSEMQDDGGEHKMDRARYACATSTPVPVGGED
ncbi:hypothetical protein MMC22_008833 [Lobaria immixta]|nr:hypothetical protein [Lobaria immixta]